MTRPKYDKMSRFFGVFLYVYVVRNVKKDSSGRFRLQDTREVIGKLVYEIVVKSRFFIQPR